MANSQRGPWTKYLRSLISSLYCRYVLAQNQEASFCKTRHQVLHHLAWVTVLFRQEQRAHVEQCRRTEQDLWRAARPSRRGVSLSDGELSSYAKARFTSHYTSSIISIRHQRGQSRRRPESRQSRAPQGDETQRRRPWTSMMLTVRFLHFLKLKIESFQVSRLKRSRVAETRWRAVSGIRLLDRAAAAPFFHAPTQVIQELFRLVTKVMGRAVNKVACRARCSGVQANVLARISGMPQRMLPLFFLQQQQQGQRQ